MWEKIKNVLAVIGAVFGALALAFGVNKVLGGSERAAADEKGAKANALAAAQKSLNDANQQVKEELNHVGSDNVADDLRSIADRDGKT